MRFSFSTAATEALALFSASNVPAQLTADQVVTNINTITSLSQGLQTPANSINLLSPALFLIGQGPFPQIIVGFGTIVSDVTADISAMQTPVTFAGQAATDVFNAFSDFITVHQQLLSILIGKAGLFSDIPFIGEPVAEALRQVEGVVDTVALSLASMVPTYADQVGAKTGSLNTQLEQAITAYSGLQLKKRTTRFKA